MDPVLWPPDVLKATVRPPPDSVFPFGSFAVKVSVVVLLDVTEALPTVITDWESEEAPGTTLRVGRALVIATPAMRAPMEFAVPATTPV